MSEEEKNLGFEPEEEGTEQPAQPQETEGEETTEAAESQQTPEPELPEFLKPFQNEDGTFDVNGLAQKYGEQHGYIEKLKGEKGHLNKAAQEGELYKKQYEALLQQRQASQTAPPPSNEANGNGQFRLPENHDGMLGESDLNLVSQIQKDNAKEAVKEVLTELQQTQQAKVQELQVQLAQDLETRYEKVYESVAGGDPSFNESYKKTLIAEEIKSDPEVGNLYNAYLNGRANITDNQIQEAIKNAESRVNQKLLGIKEQTQKPLFDLQKQIAAGMNPGLSAGTTQTEQADDSNLSDAQKAFLAGWV